MSNNNNNNNNNNKRGEIRKRLLKKFFREPGWKGEAETDDFIENLEAEVDKELEKEKEEKK